MLFLTSVESTIVGTSLVAISNSLGGYVKRSWVVTAYLISYTGECFPGQVPCENGQDFRKHPSEIENNLGSLSSNRL